MFNAIKKVKDTGRVFIFIGAYPKEIEAYLKRLNKQTDLIFENVLVWIYKNEIGPTPKMSFIQNIQFILYLRGKNATGWHTDKIMDLLSVYEINAPDGRLGNRHYKWQKPIELIDKLISISTNPGDLVIDCFAGSGTHLLSACKFKRRCSGCEIDKDVVKIACERGCVLLTLTPPLMGNK